MYMKILKFLEFIMVLFRSVKLLGVTVGISYPDNPTQNVCWLSANPSFLSKSDLLFDLISR